MTALEFVLLVIGCGLVLIWFGWVYIVCTGSIFPRPTERISPPEGGQSLVPRGKK